MDGEDALRVTTPQLTIKLQSVVVKVRAEIASSFSSALVSMLLVVRFTAASPPASSIQACSRLKAFFGSLTDWRESFLELISQRVGGFLLCFSNHGSSLHEGNHTGSTVQPLSVEIQTVGKSGSAAELEEIQMFAPLMSLSCFLWADLSVAALRVTVTNVISVCHHVLKLLLD